MKPDIEEIHNSLINGQRKQMVQQIDAYGIDFWEDYTTYLRIYYGNSWSVIWTYFTDATISYFRIKNR